MRILLVEDELNLANSILEFLKNDEKINCDYASNLKKAIELCELYNYDCLIVDLGLPDGSGLDVVKEIRKMNLKTGVIIISARDTLDDRIEGLNLGADDYLVKPFHLSELNARLHSLIRRLKLEGNNSIQVNEIELDVQLHRVLVNGNDVELTKSEYEILFFLMTNKNQIISKSSIAEYLVGESVDVMGSLDFVYLHIKNLRKKLTLAGAKDYLKNVYGVGYKFEV